MSSALSAARIVIADEQPIFRDGMRRLLEADLGLQIVGDACLGPDAAALVRSLNADVVLLGLSPSEQPPLETLRGIAASGLPVRIIVLVGADGRADVTDAVRLGARGVVSKQCTVETLFESIRTVMAGRCWIGDDRVADTATNPRAAAALRRHKQAFGLTSRELDIVRAVTDGNQNKEIAARFSISENNVKPKLRHVFN